MKIFLISDIHYGGSPNTQSILGKFIKRSAKMIEECDLMVSCGDWISHRQRSFPPVFKMFRKAFGDKPILTVLGNHCLWSYESFHPDYQSQYKKKKLTYEIMREQQREWMFENKIHYLSDSPYEKEDIIFLGFDGYYSEIPPRSNDPKFMPREAKGVPIHQYLNKKAHDRLDEILIKGSDAKKLGKKIVCCTHFNLIQDYGWEHMSGNPHYLQALCNVPFDLILWGHNHKKEDILLGQTRICNAGGDYDIPRAMLVEL